jgi:hypothetical protein
MFFKYFSRFFNDLNLIKGFRGLQCFQGVS